MPRSARPTHADLLRCVLAPLLLAFITSPAVFQPALDRAWASLRQSTIYQWSTFETIWTVLCYSVIEPSLTTVFIRNPAWRLKTSHQSSATRSKPRGMRRPSRRLGEIAIYVLPLLTMDLTMIKKYADVPLEEILRSGNHYSHDQIGANRTLATSQPPKTFLIPTLHNFTMESPLQFHRALPYDAPSSRRLALELITSFIIYDASFFLFHLALHILPPLNHWHRAHHSHDAQLNPQVTNQLSIAERLGLIMLANFSLNILGAHVLTRTLFVPVFVWLLVEIHCGLDLPWAYDKILPRGWGGGARKHMRHHNTGGAGYEPFFCWLDTIWERVATAPAIG